MLQTLLEPGIEPAAASLHGTRVAFTGKLSSMTHDEAFRVVRSGGGRPMRDISRMTDLLVVGGDGFPVLGDGSISLKLRRAEELRRRGAPLRIISEIRFLELAGLEERRDRLPKSFPAHEVCALLGISGDTLDRWEHFGLVHSEAGHFDFKDIVSLRTIAELVQRGVTAEVITRSVRGLSRLVPDMDRPLAQLTLVAEHPGEVLADLGEVRLAPDGQLVIDFDQGAADDVGPIPLTTAALPPSPPARLPDSTWFERARVYEETEQYDEAIRSYRQAIRSDPSLVEAHFNLANILRLLDHYGAAEERYRIATELEPDFVCAWYNLADLQEELERVGDAIESLEHAIRADPNFADAHFNLACLYVRVGHRDEATPHWRTYLRYDTTSHWAEVARRYLDEGAE